MWHLLKAFDKNPHLVVYYADPLDYVALQPILKHLPPLPIIVKNRKTAKFIRAKGLDCHYLPSFPLAVIMCRHAAHKFPEKRIIKIGFRHGAYHFKAFANAKAYQAFTFYGATSEKEVSLLRQHGVTVARAVGLPKLDPAFDGTLDQSALDSYRQKAAIDTYKKTIIFTATWDGSGLSAIDRWIDRLHLFKDQYNVLVTVHPWTSRPYFDKLRTMQGLYFIEDGDTLPYLMIANILVGDYSSIIAEFCALDKPIVTFKVAHTKRSVSEIDQLLQDISIQIEDVNQLGDAIRDGLLNPETKSDERKKANTILFNRLDGRAGYCASMFIMKILSDK